MLNGAKSWGRPFTKAAGAQPIQRAQVASVHVNRAVSDGVFRSPGEWLQPKRAFHMWTDQHYSDKYFLWPRGTESLKEHRISQIFQKKPLCLSQLLGFLSFFLPHFPFFVVVVFFFHLVLFFLQVEKSGSLHFLIINFKCWRSQNGNVSC